MKVALIGYGKMGRVIEELAAPQDLDIVDRFTSARPLDGGEATRRALSGVEALIDFSVPEAVVDTVASAVELSLNMVIGTTGWQERYDEVREKIKRSGIGVVWASNFSLGVNIFYRVVEQAAKMFAAAEAYDPYIRDWHHRFKKDSPSGTALELKKQIAPHFGERPLPITSLRAGYVPSVHGVGFDSTADTVYLEHQARNRDGLGEGAILAAKWIAGRQGFYEFREVMDDLFPKS